MVFFLSLVFRGKKKNHSDGFIFVPTGFRDIKKTIWMVCFLSLKRLGTKIKPFRVKNKTFQGKNKNHFDFRDKKKPLG